MKYNIFTVCNKAYFPFLSVFMNSLFRKCDTSKIGSVFIADIEISAFRKFLPPSDKIKFLDTSIKDAFSGVHSDGWYKATQQKTELLGWVLSQVPENEPVLLMDSDLVVLSDFFDLIDPRYAMQFTEIYQNKHMANAGIYLNQIACFVSCNNTEVSRTFLRDWGAGINRLKVKGAGRPHETPAMNRVIREYQLEKPAVKFGFISERLICSDMTVFPDTRILHLKSSSTTVMSPPENFIDRINKIKVCGVSAVDLGFDQYVDFEMFRLWCSEYD